MAKWSRFFSMVRHGENFAENSVEFHHSDFDWAELQAEYSTKLCRSVDEEEGCGSAGADGVAEHMHQQANWEAEYERHAAKFYPIKNYIDQAFPELGSADPLTVLEVGCGTGSCVLPLLKRHPHHSYLACDFSPTALRHLKAHPLSHGANIRAFLWDVASGPLPSDSEVGLESVDLCLLIFTLSAIHPSSIPAVLRHLRPLLKDGGLVLLRDYGFLDHAHLRFIEKRAKQVAPGSFIRGNGTVASFFELSNLQVLFEQGGYMGKRMEYHCILNKNRKTDECMKKVFVNCVFQRQARDLD